MSRKDLAGSGELKVDLNNLYREETFSDLKVASLRRLTPVKPDGSTDGSRKPVFMGQAHVMLPAGPVPIQCLIQAQTLEEAARKFPDTIRQAVGEMLREVEELERREASRIIVPRTGPGGIHTQG